MENTQHSSRGRIAKIENDCARHPRNPVTLDAFVAFAKFDEKKSKKREKKNGTWAERCRGNGKRLQTFAFDPARLYYIRIPFGIDVVKFPRFVLLPPCDVVIKVKNQDTNFTSYISSLIYPPFLSQIFSTFRKLYNFSFFQTSIDALLPCVNYCRSIIIARKNVQVRKFQ